MENPGCLWKLVQTLSTGNDRSATAESHLCLWFKGCSNGRPGFIGKGFAHTPRSVFQQFADTGKTFIAVS
jgi:hypothetical protein